MWLSCGLNWAGHVAVAGAWLLWTLGALPPIDAFLLWLLEQWHVLALGMWKHSWGRGVEQHILLVVNLQRMYLFYTAAVHLLLPNGGLDAGSNRKWRQRLLNKC